MVLKEKAVGGNYIRAEYPEGVEVLCRGQPLVCPPAVFDLLGGFGKMHVYLEPAVTGEIGGPKDILLRNCINGMDGDCEK